MVDQEQKNHPAKITYHYPIIDLEKKTVKGIVTIDHRPYLSASVDLSKGMIHVEKNASESEEQHFNDHEMIEEIKEMAEFIIVNHVEGYGQGVLN